MRRRPIRKTDLWHTVDDRHICYHCGEEGNIYRFCANYDHGYSFTTTYLSARFERRCDGGVPVPPPSSPHLMLDPTLRYLLQALNRTVAHASIQSEADHRALTGKNNSIELSREVCRLLQKKS